VAFLRAARTDPLYPPFIFLLVYGMRRGEVLGLRWTGIDASRVLGRRAARMGIAPQGFLALHNREPAANLKPAITTV
jgi:integrase